MKRNPYIDFLKGLAIISVVIGHCWTIDRSLFNFIYSFHMPLFFCISGYLFSNKAPYRKFVVSKAKSILMPYVIYFATSYLCAVWLFNKPMSITEGLKALLLSGTYCSNVYNTTLWYLPLFFISVNVFYFISKIKPTALRYICIGIGVLCSIPLNKYLLTVFPDKYTPYNIQALLPSLFFMFVGYEFKKIDFSRLNKQFSKYGLPLVAFAMFILGAIMSANNTDQIISLFMTYEFYVYPLLLIPLILLLTCNFRNRYIEFAGKHSITILGFHRLLLFMFTLTFDFDTVVTSLGLNWLISTLLISALCVAIICVAKIAFDYCVSIIKRAFQKVN